MSKQITEVLKNSFKLIIKNPVIVLPALILFIFSLLFSKLSVKVNYLLTNNLQLTIWLIIFSLFSLLIGSYLITLIILLCSSSIKKEPHLLKKANNSWLKNFIIILLNLILYNIIRFLAHYLALFIGRSFNLSLNLAVIIFYLIFFAGLIGILIFISFSLAIIPIYNKGIIESISLSINLVKKNYLPVLTITILFFILYQLVQYIPNPFVIDLISSLLLLPYFTAVLVYLLFILKEK